MNSNPDPNLTTDGGHATKAGPVVEATGGAFGLLLTFVIAIGVVCLLVAVIWDTSVAGVALLSGVVCLVAAMAGHYLSIYPRGEVFRLARLYQSMAIRLGLPILFLFVCKASFEELFSQGMAYFVFLFYLVGLLTDVVVQTRQLRLLQAENPVPGRPVRGKSQAG